MLEGPLLLEEVLQHVEGLLGLSALGDDALAVEEVLRVVVHAARAVEVHEHPGRHPDEGGLAAPHGELAAEHFGLILLRPLLRHIAETACHGTGTKLCDDDGFLRGDAPFVAVAVGCRAAIPSDVLVHTDDVNHREQRVGDGRRVLAGSVDGHRHAEQPLLVGLLHLLGQTAEELVARLTLRQFVADAPYDDAAAVVVAVDHLLQLA